MYIEDRTIPDLPAYHDPDGCQRIWCRHCACWHRHGVGEGHRVAHCVPAASPYKDGGYILVDAGPFTEDVRRRHRIGRIPRCPGCREPIPFDAGLERCPRCTRPLPAPVGVVTVPRSHAPRRRDLGEGGGDGCR